VTDADLVARTLEGDQEAFGELVDRHRLAVYRAALTALGSPAEAEDAAQEAFLLAYRRLESFRGAASFKTWLLSIAWHQAINRRRGLARVWRRMVGTSPYGNEHDRVMASVASAERTPEEATAHRQLVCAVRLEIMALKPRLREALLLAQSGEYTYDDIGAMVNAPVGTIKWRVSEARRVLKQRLRERGHGSIANER
jgi:RNA polymerase sigma-70 factor (ECF subfamily)